MVTSYRWRPPKTHLSPREQEILKLAAQGQRVNQIARTLWLSPHTVRNHLKSAYRILRASDLAEALLRAIARGEIPLPPADSTDGRGEGKL
jgi:DNA-binding CsgD family transcriptional regulator